MKYYNNFAHFSAKNKVGFSMHSLFICISVHSSVIWAFRSNQISCRLYSSAQINVAVLAACIWKKYFQIIFVSELSIWVLQIFGHSHALDLEFTHLFTQPCANWLICFLMIAYPFHNFLVHSLLYGVWSLHLSFHCSYNLLLPIPWKSPLLQPSQFPFTPHPIPQRKKVLQNCF